MSKFEPGELVWLHPDFSFQTVSGVVVTSRMSLWGRRYLVQYNVYDLDRDYRYKKAVWRAWWRVWS